MRKKFGIIIVVIVIISIILVGCTKNSPEATLDKFFKSVRVLYFEESETLMAENVVEETLGILDSSEDKDEDEEDVDFTKIEGFKDAKKELSKITKSLDYRVLESNVSESSAVIRVEIEYVDAGEVFVKTISEIFAKGMSMMFTEDAESITIEDEYEMLFKTFTESVEGFQGEMISVETTVSLIKTDDDKWIISEVEEEFVNAISFNFMSSFEDALSNMFGGFEE